MAEFSRFVSICIALSLLSWGCSGGGNSTVPRVPEPIDNLNGSLSISLTDGPWADAHAMVLHITGIEIGRANGEVIHFDIDGGPITVDMMQLQNGVFQTLITEAGMPVGQYEWIRLQLDMDQSYIDLAGTGGRHGMQMSPDAANGLEVHSPFQISQSTSSEFMLDFDLRRGVQSHNRGMMGQQFDLHSAIRLVDMRNAGGLTGMVAAAMVDINHPECDSTPGGNWAYIFPGDALAPDDIAETEMDGMLGPLAADRVEMDPRTGDHIYHFAFLEPGSYRIAFSCSGEWDEEADDDYRAEPDGRFDFRMFSTPISVTAGEMHRFDLMP
jgi:hypothetical protein